MTKILLCLLNKNKNSSECKKVKFVNDFWPQREKNNTIRNEDPITRN